MKGEAPPGLKLLQLMAAADNDTLKLVSRILHATRREPDCERVEMIVELVEEVLLRRFNQLTREEIRHMFQFAELRDTRVWKDAQEEGIEIGEERIKRQLVKRLKSKGKTLKEISELFEIPVAEVRRLVKEEN